MNFNNNTGIKYSYLSQNFIYNLKKNINLVSSELIFNIKNSISSNSYKNFQTFKALNSFYDPRFAQNEDEQIKELKDFIGKWNSEKNIVFITHYVVILSLLNEAVSSGEIIISDKDFNVVGRVETF